MSEDYSFRIINAHISEYHNNNNSFITDSWSISQAQSNNAIAQKMINHNANPSRR